MPATAYPFREQIQRSFGPHDISSIRAHRDAGSAEAARQLNARAFTFGNHVAFEGTPDLHTAAHEAAHTLQQRAGARSGAEYERHADAVADRVVRNESAAGLLDAMPASAGASRQPVVQRAEKTRYGVFDTTHYDDLTSALGNKYGVDIELTFDPSPTAVDARKIGLTQTVRVVEEGTPVSIHPSLNQRMVPAGEPGEGTRIDRETWRAYANPLYAAKVPGPADTLGDTPTSKTWGQHGWHYTEGKTVQHQMAKLIDTPGFGDIGHAREQVFETAALAVEGTQAGTYMGSVEWGWKMDAAGKFTKLPLKKKSDDIPTPAFMAAAKQWNKSETPGTIKTTADPTPVFDDNLAPSFAVERNVEVTVGSSMQDEKLSYNEVEIKSGASAGKKGWIRTTDLTDVGGGRATIPLPIQRVSVIHSEDGGVELKAFHEPSSPALAMLPDGTLVNVIHEWGAWAEVQVKAEGAGIVSGSLTKPDIAGMIRGYVPLEVTR